MVMDSLGLALCVFLTYSVRHQPKMRLLLPLFTFPVLVSIDLVCIYHELKATHLTTLNRERAELVAERWLQDGRVFTAKEVETVAIQSRSNFTFPFTYCSGCLNSPSDWLLRIVNNKQLLRC